MHRGPIWGGRAAITFSFLASGCASEDDRGGMTSDQVVVDGANVAYAELSRDGLTRGDLGDGLMMLKDPLYDS